MENQNITGTAPETQQEKTFTQDQVNAIVGKRLAEAKASQESELNKRETELKQREMQIRAKELLSERGLPKDLANVLRYSDEESLKTAIDAIERTRGFKNDDEKNAPKKKIIVNDLPQPSERYERDPIRKAMGLE